MRLLGNNLRALFNRSIYPLSRRYLAFLLQASLMRRVFAREFTKSEASREICYIQLNFSGVSASIIEQFA